MISLLLAAGAAVNVAMRDGTTALHTATYKGHTLVVRALIGAGAAVQSRCYDGVTALLMAAKSGKEELVNGGARVGLAPGPPTRTAGPRLVLTA